MKLRLTALLCTFAGLLACSRPCEVVWTEGETDPETQNAIHTMEIRNVPAGTDWTLWFCQFRTPVTMQEGAPASIVHLGGTLYRVIPEEAVEGVMTLRYETKPLVNHGRAPEGFFLERSGKKPVPVKVSYVWQPSERVPRFAWNPVPTTPFDMIPRLKKIDLREGVCEPVPGGDVTFVEGQKPGWYRITLGETVTVEAADEDGAFYAGVTLENIRRNAAGAPVQQAVIEDWPDLGYRGIMLDVSRNFTQKKDVLRLIDILAHYKINYFHLHFADDEGWRVAIDALPELTAHAAFRGLPKVRPDGSLDEADALKPAYCGTLDRKDRNSPANGFYTHEDFVEILRYAWERRIRVIPEFDTPGHSRAAIHAMEYRAAKTGDDSFLLSEAADTSKYMSAQDYTDNALNVALPSAYKFVETVFDAIIAYYQEAEVPLVAVHVGGDEVPKGAWTGSPACQALMQELGATEIGAVKEYYINRVLDIAEARGVKIAGWQEVSQHLTPATFERLKKNLAFINFWTVSRGRETLGYRFADEGVDVVLSNAPNFYFDFAYSPDKQERGHSWGGFVDERRCFSFLPYNMYRSVRWDDKGEARDLAAAADGKTPLTEEGRKHIVGVSGQLWTETIRSFDHVTYYLFPKSLGLPERGWNAVPAWEQTTVADDPAFMEDFDRFYSTVQNHEFPYFDSLGISYRK